MDIFKKNVSILFEILKVCEKITTFLIEEKKLKKEILIVCEKIRQPRLHYISSFKNYKISLEINSLDSLNMLTVFLFSEIVFHFIVNNFRLKFIHLFVHYLNTVTQIKSLLLTQFILDYKFNFNSFLFWNTFRRV
jgi:hypothetical protein